MDCRKQGFEGGLSGSVVEWLEASGCYSTAWRWGTAMRLSSLSAAATLLGRIDLPLRLRRWLRDSSRSRIASAIVASPIHARFERSMLSCVEWIVGSRGLKLV